MTKGDWDGALRLIEEMRVSRADYQRKLDERGIVQRRVRIVSKPVSPYLQWELHGLRLFAELGENVRVLPADEIRYLETARELPEVVVLGGESTAHPVMYEIVYRDGILAGGRKFTDRRLIDACRAEITGLWERGEDLAAFFDREIAHLPPPSLRGV